MSQKVKITKKDLRQDKFTMTMLQAKDNIVEHWIYYVGGLVVLFLLVFGITYVKQEGQTKNVHASELFNRGMSEFMNKDYELAASTFISVIDEFGSSVSAEKAMFNLGNAYFNNNNFDKAIETFQEYLKKYGGKDKYFTTSAMAGIAASLAAKGEPQQAADTYREAAERFENFNLAGRYYIKAIEQYVAADKVESAKVVFAKLKKDYVNTAYYDEALVVAAENNLTQ
ncbi:MAG: tetratricopeptide repeat protein [Candidatus Zixiibacteriota bacterium]